LEQQNYVYHPRKKKLGLDVEDKLEIDKIMNNKEYRFYPKNIYYSLDGHNIFKRVDRYRHKLYLIIAFSFLILLNIHELVFNLVHLFNKIDPDYPDQPKHIGHQYKINESSPKSHFYNNWDITSELLGNLYIFGIHLLSIYIFCKFDIDTKIYY